MYRRMMQGGTDLLHYQAGVLAVEKLPVYRYFGLVAMAFFACFPFGMLTILLPGSKALLHTPHGLRFVGGLCSGSACSVWRAWPYFSLVPLLTG